MKAFGYCRVSSVGQAEEGVSMDGQRAKIAAWCAATDAELVEVFQDAGISGGKTTNRPGLQAALAAVCQGKGKGKGNVLVVYSLSRMARSTRDALAISERLRKAGADLASITERIDTTSAAGKMIFRMLAVMAEFERDVAGERTKMAAAFKRSKGEAWAHAPFGQAKDDAGKLVDDAGELVAIAEVVRLRAAGKTIRAVVAAMNAGPLKSRGGGRWHIRNVQRILGRVAGRSAAAPASPPGAGPITDELDQISSH